VYVTTRVPGVVIALAVATAFSLGSAPWVALGLDVLLVALVVADVVLAPRPSSMRIERDIPAVLSVGRQDHVTLTCHNPTDRRLDVDGRDATPPSLGRVPSRHALVLAPRGWARAMATVVPSRRGMHTVGPITIRTGGPLGLAGRQGTLGIETRVKIYPALPGRAEVELRLERARLLQTGERSSALRGGGTEFDALREYHPDDEFRRINWRATARAGKPITNTYREERNQQVIVLLDAGRLMATTVAGVSLFEHGLDAAMAVAELGGRLGDHIGGVAFSSRMLATVPPRGGRAQPRRLLDAMYAVSPALEAPNYRLAFSTVLSRWRRRSLLVLLTELADEAALDSLFAALPAVLHRHLVIVAAARDPSVEALAVSDPADSMQAYEKAAAAAAVAARERTASRLSAMGAEVVDRLPGSLAGAVADRYLHIKALGRL
jgi:uncharacterized protein (DUF58 family)